MINIYTVYTDNGYVEHFDNLIEALKDSKRLYLKKANTFITVFVEKFKSKVGFECGEPCGEEVVQLIGVLD